jgi:hypothetical protein
VLFNEEMNFVEKFGESLDLIDKGNFGAGQKRKKLVSEAGGVGGKGAKSSGIQKVPFGGMGELRSQERRFSGLTGAEQKMDFFSAILETFRILSIFIATSVKFHER